jgi:GH24 family phage-related lysozyme (muramidase)
MAFDLLKAEFYDAGRGAPNLTVNKLASKINDLAKLGDQYTKMQIEINDQEGKKAALADKAQGIIDPMKEENDMAYAAVMTRTKVEDKFLEYHNALKDPANPLNREDPKDFKQRLQDEAREFYKANAETPFANVKADVFGKYTLVNQTKLIAQQAANFKANRKQDLSQLAVKSLANQGPMNPEAYDLNTYEVLEKVMPKTMFTPEEREAHIMTAAMQNAAAGDPRLMQFAIKAFDADIMYPKQTALCQKGLDEFKAVQMRDYWNTQYKDREEMANAGAYTSEMWDADMDNADMVKNMTRSKLASWRAKSVSNEIKLRNSDARMKAIRLGLPADGTDEEFGKDFEQVLSDLTEQAGGDVSAAWGPASEMLAKSGRIVPNLKKTFNTLLGRDVWSPEEMESEAFDKIFTLASQLDSVMSNDQMQKQLGDRAYTNFKLVEDLMAGNGGDYKKAAAALVAITQKRKEANLTTRLSGEEAAALDDIAEDMLSGSFDGSDPELNKWFGLASKGGNAMYTGGMKARLKRHAELLVLRGMSPMKAMEVAGAKEAKNHKWFGNEMQYTGGADVSAVYGFRPGTTPKEMDEALEYYAEMKLGADPENLHIQRNGNYMYITTEDGETLPPVPFDTMANIWQNKKDIEEHHNRAMTFEQESMRQDSINDRFYQGLIESYGENNTTMEIIPGVKMKDWLLADNERRTEIRLQYLDLKYKKEKEIAGSIAKVIKSAGSSFKEAWKGLVTDAQPGDDDYDFPEIDVEKEMRETYPTSDKYGYNAGNEFAGISGQAEIRSGAVELKENPIKVDPAGLSELHKDLIDGEGAVGVIYHDSVKKRTIGIGHNLDDNPFDAEELEKFGPNRDWRKEPMTQEEAIWLLDRDIKEAKALAGRKFPGFNELSQDRRDAIVNLQFNLGGKLNPKKQGGTMPGVFAAIKAGDWQQAVKELKYKNGKSGTLTQWWDQIQDSRKKTIVDKLLNG